MVALDVEKIEEVVEDTEVEEMDGNVMPDEKVKMEEEIVDDK